MQQAAVYAACFTSHLCPYIDSHIDIVMFGFLINNKRLTVKQNSQKVLSHCMGGMHAMSCLGDG